MRSNVNISGIARTASASGVKRLILTGNAKLIKKIARDGADELSVEVRRSLGHLAARLGVRLLWRPLQRRQPVALKRPAEGFSKRGRRVSTNRIRRPTERTALNI